MNEGSFFGKLTNNFMSQKENPKAAVREETKVKDWERPV